MADITVKTVDAANHYRRIVGEFLTALNALVATDAEYDALAVGSNLPLNAFTDITNAEFSTSVGTVKSLFTYLDGAGIKTNLYKLSDGSHR